MKTRSFQLRKAWDSESAELTAKLIEATGALDSLRNEIVELEHRRAGGSSKTSSRGLVPAPTGYWVRMRRSGLNGRRSRTA